MRELPAQCRTSQAVRVWRARESDPQTCEWYERMFDDDEVITRHPVARNVLDYWWIAGPIEKPRRAGEAHPPDFGELVCNWCLPRAVDSYMLSWEEANL